MAELEVAEHGKKVIQLARSKEHPLLHKAREILLEIAIIVFAVSISIWFHSMSEHRHEQQQVKAFLLGLKTDLARDITQLTEMQAAYRNYDSNYAYLAALDPQAKPEDGKFDEAFSKANSNWQFIPENSRFEGFKAAGKLTNIEDDQLLNDILTLYQGNLRMIRNSESGWGNNQGKLRAYLDSALENGDELAQRYRAMTTPKAKRLLRNMQTYPQLYERYQLYAALGRTIVERIEKKYGAGA